MKKATLALLIIFSAFAFAKNGHAYLTPNIATIAITAHFNLSEEVNSPERKEAAKIWNSSKALTRENIQNIAAKYLTSKLKKEVSVVVMDRKNVEKIPKGESTLILDLVYSVWPEKIDGKDVVLGAIAVHTGRLRDGGNYMETPVARPVEPFVVDNEPQKTQANLEATIARLLQPYSYTRGYPSNE